jgi:hypothetical protein
MVNLPKMLFNITRLYPEVGLKNNYIWTYKNHLGSFHKMIFIKIFL